MHRGVAVGVHRVDVGPEIEQQLGGDQRLGLAARFLVGGVGAEAGRRHQGRARLGVGQERVGAQLEELLHEARVGPVGGHEEGRRPLHLETRRGVRRAPALLEAQVHVGPQRDEGPHELQAGQVARPLRRGVAPVAGVRLPDPAHGVQRGKAGPLVVGVGAGLDQLDRELEVAVAHRQQQRAHAVVDGPIGRVVDGAVRPVLDARELGVHVHAGIEQGPGGVDVSSPHREEERGEAGAQGGVHVGAGREQRLHDGRVSLGRRPHQGGLLAGLARVGVGAFREQGLDRGEAPGAGRGHQHGLAAAKRRVGVGPGVEEQAHEAGVAVGGGQRQRRHAVTVHGVDVGAGPHQQPRRLDVVVVRRPVEGGHAVDLRHVDVGAPRVQQGADQRGVPRLGRVGEGGLAGRPRGSGQPQRQHRQSGDSSWMHRFFSWPANRRLRLRWRPILQEPAPFRGVDPGHGNCRLAPIEQAAGPAPP